MNAIVPGLVGTALTFNEQRFRAAIAQANELNLPHHFASDLYRDV